jgi:hypothetical protein
MDCDTWPVPLVDYGGADLCVSGCTIPNDTDPELLEAASVKAGVILRTLSGNRVGTCTDVVRPLSECATCHGLCRCVDAGDRIRLSSPYGPVTGVEAVNDGGTLLLPDEYRFYPSGQLLYRVPPDVWPNRDLKWADCGEADTFCVTVVVGYEPDAWALDVHAELTCELLASCTGGPCRLPSTASTVTGQGVTITLTPEQVAQFIPSVARWVAAVNPDNAQSLPRLYSPDLSGCGGQGGAGTSSGGTPTIDGGWA